MAVLVTGAAGFIGAQVALALLARGEQVIGIDNLNDYYDVRLKQARLALLEAHKGFVFAKINIADRDAMQAVFIQNKINLEGVIHLAAQAGVRYSLENPFAYLESNITGQVVLLEAARHLPRLKNFIYASSSSVYGGNSKVPFAVEDAVEKPMSMYAATKRADELFGHTYHHLYGLPLIGLRFFTVYGPWGRPDMAAFLFTGAILRGEPIKVFNHGRMRRDFTYIDDIVAGVLAALDRPQPTHRLYNLGNAHPEELVTFIATLEQALGVKAQYQFLPLQAGDVPETSADITSSSRDLGFLPRISIAEGIPRFVEWYREYHKI